MSKRSYFHLANQASKPLFLALVVLAGGLQNARAQSFNSGSTGVDGALDLSNLSPGTVLKFNPANFNPALDQDGDNVYHFTTINIPTGITVRLSGDVLNGPVWWLATGDVQISGTIDLNGENAPGPALILASRRRAVPGAGGYSGGIGGKADLSSQSPQPVAQPGDGPLGGAADATGGTLCVASGGGFSGNPFVVPLVGGSGGGGVNNLARNPNEFASAAYGIGGGAGGGALLIASSTSIVVNGIITANGGNDALFNSIFESCESGAGAGGGIRLVAPVISGNGRLTARGGSVQNVAEARATDGAIRLEAFQDLFGGTFNGTPETMGSPFSVFLPATPPPSVQVTSVNGVNITQPPTGSLATPDATINATSPVLLTVQASHIPPGTVLTLHVFSDNGTDQTIQSTPLQGTLQSSTATANVTFPSGFSLNYVKATWTQ